MAAASTRRGTIRARVHRLATSRRALALIRSVAPPVGLCVAAVAILCHRYHNPAGVLVASACVVAGWVASGWAGASLEALGPREAAAVHALPQERVDDALSVLLGLAAFEESPVIREAVEEAVRAWHGGITGRQRLTRRAVSGLARALRRAAGRSGTTDVRFTLMLLDLACEVRDPALAAPVLALCRARTRGTGREQLRTAAKERAHAFGADAHTECCLLRPGGSAARENGLLRSARPTLLSQGCGPEHDERNQGAAPDVPLRGAEPPG